MALFCVGILDPHGVPSEAPLQTGSMDGKFIERRETSGFIIGEDFSTLKLNQIGDQSMASLVRSAGVVAAFRAPASSTECSLAFF